jgi:hypothetical protein
VISDPDGDPPRMLDAPMAEADARGVPAVAILFGPIGIVGGGHSDRAVEVGDPATLTGPSVDGFIARGDADAALAIVVDHLVAWVRAGPSVQGAPPVVEELGPSGTPSP